MSTTAESMRVKLDATNPGQFFACCGLLELADRLWNGAEGWFENGHFHIKGGDTLSKLIQSVSTAELVQIDPDDNTSSPLELGEPFRRLRLDWWQDALSGGREMKVWAGTMESGRIARAMQFAMREKCFRESGLFDIGMIAYDPDDREKKVEPFYFDARRGPNAHSRDVGFSPNDLQMTTTAFPAVEFLCLIGLQRCLPSKTNQRRIYDFYTWSQPMPVNLIAGVVCGMIPATGRQGYRFENWYRTGQKKHKAFRSAIPLSTETER